MTFPTAQADFRSRIASSRIASDEPDHSLPPDTLISERIRRKIFARLR
jgi:hypothetical protein